MKVLSYSEFLAVNESITLNTVEGGMVVVYSKSGRENDYQHWICLSDEKDIEKYVDGLKWRDTVTDADKKSAKRMKKLLVAYYGGCCDFVNLEDVVVTNISYIYNPKLKPKEMLDKNKLKDLKNECSEKNLIYSKDVNIDNIVLKKPDVPYLNYGYRFNDYMAVSRGETTYDLGGVYGILY